MAKMKIVFSASEDSATFRALIDMEVVCRHRLGLKTKIGSHNEGSRYIDDLFVEFDEKDTDHIRWLWTKINDYEHEKELKIEE